MNIQSLLEVGKEATRQANVLIRECKPGTITQKGDRDMATEVDYAVEKMVKSFLFEQTPDFGFFGEENGREERGAGQAFWVLDPVDGTANFARGIPLSGVSLGLIDRGRTLLGIIELPFLHERYWAVAGAGAFSETGPINASGAYELNDAIVSIGDYAVGPEAAKKNSTRFAVTELLASNVQRIRMLGSAATDLAWVAQGRLDAAVILSNKPWDTAAGVLISREAGAIALDRMGNEHTINSDSTIVMATGLAPALMQLLHDVL